MPTQEQPRSATLQRSFAPADSSDYLLSADGRRIVTAAKDKLFKLWNVDAGQELISVKIASASR